MTTNDKSLKVHPRQERLEAHHEAQRLAAHQEAAAEETAVPAVTADVDETPGYIRYGAAILLGLVFGVGCYVWMAGGVPSAPQNPGNTLRIAPTEAYFTHAGTYEAPSAQGVLPDPFVSPFEPTYEQLPTGTVTYAYDAYAQNADGSATAEDAYGDYSAGSAHELVAVASSASPVVYLFSYGSAAVPENDELTQIAKDAARQGLTLDVRAYTDEHGRPKYNQRLSEKRARAIGDYLIAHGVPASKVSVHGMGPTHAYANDAQDRRAEVIVVK